MARWATTCCLLVISTLVSLSHQTSSHGRRHGDNNADEDIDQSLERIIKRLWELEKKSANSLTGNGNACTSQAADIIIVLGTGAPSGDIQERINFIDYLLKNLDLGPEAIRVGGVTFSNPRNVAFELGELSDATRMTNAFQNGNYRLDRKEMMPALQEVQDMFSRSSRDRTEKILIFVGQANVNDFDEANAALQELKKNVTVLGVNMGSFTNFHGAEMVELATDSDSVFTPVDEEGFGQVVHDINDRLCETIENGFHLTIPRCEGKRADVIFMMDASGSVGAGNFGLLKTFIEKVVQGLDIGAARSHVGMIRFSTSTSVEIALGSETVKMRLTELIGQISYTQGGTNTYRAINQMVDIFSRRTGIRAQVPAVGVVLTDGQSNSPSTTANSARAARDAGINMVSVGIGSGASVNELNAIASGTHNVLTIQDFNTLVQMVDRLSEIVCDAIEAVQDGGAAGELAPLLNCTFEDGDCGLQTGGGADWEVVRAWSQDLRVDHTTHTTSGHYMLADAVMPFNQNVTYTATFGPFQANGSPLCLSYSYAIFTSSSFREQHEQQLHVGYKQGTAPTTWVWYIAGDHEAQWFRHKFPLPVTSGSFSVVFKAVSDEGFYWEIGVDNVLIKQTGC